MYKKIMIPVDLGQTDKLGKALETASGIAKNGNGRIIAAGVTTLQPSSVAHSPDEFAQKLAEFAEAASKRYGVAFIPEALTSHDPVRDLDQTLMTAIDEHGVDLVVMASHVPGAIEHVFASNAGYLAAHAPVSVFVVR